MDLKDFDIDYTMRLKTLVIAFYDSVMADFINTNGYHYKKHIETTNLDKLTSLLGITMNEIQHDSSDPYAIVKAISEQFDYDLNSLLDMYSNTARSSINSIIHSSNSTLWGKSYLSMNIENIGLYKLKVIPDVVVFDDKEVLQFIEDVAIRKSSSSAFLFLERMPTDKIASLAGVDKNVFFDVLKEVEAKSRKDASMSTIKIEALVNIKRLDKFLENYTNNDVDIVCEILSFIGREASIASSEKFLQPKATMIDYKIHYFMQF